MAITYPLTPPATPGFTSLKWMPKTVVGYAYSPFTGQAQTYVWPGAWWEVEISIAPCKDAAAGAWVAFLLALNGQQGTFNLGDSVRKTSLGTITGAPTCNGAQTANGTTLTLTGHTGSLAVGDWIQIGTNLHKVIQVNSGTSVDVWPKLRSAYAGGTAIVYINAKGLFRLASNDAMNWDVDTAKFYGLTIRAMEAL